MPQANELAGISNLFNGLLLAFRNVSLYPKGHSIASGSIQQFHRLLDSYLRVNWGLKLEIERDRTAYEGETVYSATGEGTLPFILFRDGIRWFEFIEGISAEEIEQFLAIIHQYTNLSNEPDGDIATAFWEAQFPHIQYEATDFFSGAEEAADEMPFAKPSSQSAKLREEGTEAKLTSTDPPIDFKLLELSNAEINQLQNMINEEGNADDLSYVNALLDCLLSQENEENLDIILDVLMEEVKLSLTRREFEATLRIIKGLRRIVEDPSAGIRWAVPSIENFIMTASSEKSLSPLVGELQDINVHQIDVLAQLLRSLHPEAIYTIGLMLEGDPPIKVRQMLLDTLVFLASADIQRLESLLSSCSDSAMEKLIPALADIKSDVIRRRLLKLTSHDSAAIRQKAVRTVIIYRLASSLELFSLIDDPDEAIRKMALKQVGLSRDPAIEKLLLSRLKSGKTDARHPEELVEYFKALGLCGSSLSIPFLRETLFQGKWMPAFWKSAYRKGAAVGLNALKLPEAQSILDEALHSKSPGLRGTVTEAVPSAGHKKGGR